MKNSVGLRIKLQNKELIRVAGVQHGLSARIAQQYAYDAVWVSGLGVSALHSVPDKSILGMNDIITAASEINECCDIPVIVDCDTGFGNELNVKHLTRRLDSRGIFGMCMEDKQFPKSNSFSDDKQALSCLESYTDKLKTALDTRTRSDLLVIARTEAFIIGAGIEEALKRVSLYGEVGADLVIVHSKKKDPSEIREFMKLYNNKTPIAVLPTTYPHIKGAELHSMGIQMVIYANQALRSTVKAMNTIYQQILIDDTSEGIEDQCCPVSELLDLVEY